MLRRWGLALIIPAVFVPDRLFKTWVIGRFQEGEGFPVIPGIFHVTRVNNTGAAFGLLRQASFFLILVSVFCVLFLSWCVWRNGAADVPSAQRLRNTAWCLVIGGALGNLYDRLVHGYVIDFLDLRVWPVFNFADAAICAGVILALYSLTELS